MKKIDINRLSKQNQEKVINEIKAQNELKCQWDCPFNLDTLTYCNGYQKEYCNQDREEKLLKIIDKYTTLYIK